MYSINAVESLRIEMKNKKFYVQQREISHSLVTCRVKIKFQGQHFFNIFYHHKSFYARHNFYEQFFFIVLASTKTSAIFSIKNVHKFF